MGSWGLWNLSVRQHGMCFLALSQAMFLCGCILADPLNPPFFISADTRQHTESGLSQAMEILLSCDYSLLWISHPFICLSLYTLGDNPPRLIAISLLVYAFVCQQDYGTWFPVVESLAQWSKKYFPIEPCRCPAPKGERGISQYSLELNRARDNPGPGILLLGQSQVEELKNINSNQFESSFSQRCLSDQEQVTWDGNSFQPQIKGWYSELWASFLLKAPNHAILPNSVQKDRCRNIHSFSRPKYPVSHIYTKRLGSGRESTTPENSFKAWLCSLHNREDSWCLWSPKGPSIRAGIKSLQSLTSARTGRKLVPSS